MRILAAFFTVIFIFINPTMFLNVLSELEVQLRDYLRSNSELNLLKALLPSLTADAILKAFSDLISITVTIVAVVHLVVTVLTLYGIYACQPKLIRPMVVNAASSLLFLLLFVMHSLYSCWRANRLPKPKLITHTSSDRYLRNVYIGAAFLLTYFIWLSITMAAYLDVAKLRADFMYWVVEERACHNTEALPSSSRGSRLSRTSRLSHTIQPEGLIGNNV